MQDDERCCGTGTCIIDAQGRCWCGQQWDGTQMCRPSNDAAPSSATVQTGNITHGNEADPVNTP